jgi:hypothetical protein
MGSARAWSPWNALGSLAVLAVVAVIGVGLRLVDQSLPAARTVAQGLPFGVGAKVSMVPPAGASVDVTGTRPGADRGTALFLLDGVRVVVVVSPYRGTLSAAATRLHAKIANAAGFQVIGDGQPVKTAQGITGLRGGYSSPGKLGEYAVFVADARSVEVTASGPENDLRAVSPLLLASLVSVAFGAAG